MNVGGVRFDWEYGVVDYMILNLLFVNFVGEISCNLWKVLGEIISLYDINF